MSIEADELLAHRIDLARTQILRDLWATLEGPNGVVTFMPPASIREAAHRVGGWPALDTDDEGGWVPVVVVERRIDMPISWVEMTVVVK